MSPFSARCFAALLLVTASSCASDRARVPEGPSTPGHWSAQLPVLLAEVKASPEARRWQAPTTPIVERTATSLAASIRAGELNSLQVVTAFLERIAAANGPVNAVVTLDAARALARARAADEALARGEVWGPLHGVPFTIKDTFRTAGLRTTAGAIQLADHVPTEDAVVVQRLFAAGAILLGKTNTPTLAMDMQTNNPVFGRTGNAWDPARTAGGSSGGAAVAVALGMTPFDVGTDLAGSIRLPASYNGVYGLRPTFGVTPLRGHIPPLPRETDGIKRMAVAGPLARSIDDLALLLEVLAGPGPGDHRVGPLAPLTKKDAGVAALTIAWTDEVDGAPVEASVREALAAFVARLQAAGAKVTRASPRDFPYTEAWETWGALVGMQGGYERSNFERTIGDWVTHDTVAPTPMQRRVVGPVSLEGYMKALNVQEACIERLEDFLVDYDLWVVPVSATTAFPHLAPSRSFGDFSVYDTPVQVDGKPVPYYVATQAWTGLFSLTESPVLAFPIGVDGQGMPIGVQLVGRRFRDRDLLAAAAQLAALNGGKPLALAPIPAR
jgi:amidase